MFKPRLAVICSAVLSAILLSVTGSSRSLPADDKIIGRWDITIREAGGSEYPSWFETKREGEKLSGRYVGRTGSQLPISTIEFTNGHLSFTVQLDGGVKFDGQLKGDQLEGTVIVRPGQELKWTAVRAPKTGGKANPRWGKPITLFNGKDLAGWRLRNSGKASSWKVVDGVLENTPRGSDLITEQKFTDFKIHVEFKVIDKSNSGVYLRGRYEVQIQEDYGKEPESHRCAGVYGFLTPSSNPAKPIGEWQTFDITFVGRRVTVVFNDKTVIDNAEVPGITGGALDSHEGEPGPIVLQGDHTQIYYRSVVITPAK